MIKKFSFAILMILTAAHLNAQTSRIEFEAPLKYPEGTDWDAAGQRFFVSSATTGAVGTVSLDGIYKTFHEDSSLKSSFGMKIDQRRGRLLICTGDPNYSKYKDTATYQKMIRLIGLDLSSGKKVLDVDLSGLYVGKHFANDLTLDSQGNIFITDSYSPAIYKVDASGNATLYSTSLLFKGEDIGLNGIAWHPDGYLLTVNNSNGALIKVNPMQPDHPVLVDAHQFFPGADGLLINQKGDLVLVQNKGVNKVFILTSKDHFNSASITAATAAEDRFAHPSTATMQGDKLYILNSKLNELNDPTQAPSKKFSLQVAEPIVVSK